VTITGTGFKDLGLTTPTVSFTPIAGGARTWRGQCHGGLRHRAHGGDPRRHGSGRRRYFEPRHDGLRLLREPRQHRGAGGRRRRGRWRRLPLRDPADQLSGPVRGTPEGWLDHHHHGSGFEDPGLSLTGVTFEPTDGGAAAALDGDSATVVSDSVITVVTPDATAAAGGAGTLDTTVTAAFDDSQAPGESVLSAPAAAGDTAYAFGVPVVNSVAPAVGGLTEAIPSPSPGPASRILR